MDRAENAAAGENGRADRPDRATLREYHELWFALAKRQWTSVVLVPADPGASAASIGKSLAEIGSRLSELPVTAISVSSLEYDSALALADLQQHLGREQRGTIERAPTIEVTATEIGDSPEDESTQPTATRTEALALVPTARLIISIPAVVSEPLGLAATQVADVIVLTIEMGRTRIADAQRTIDLIGRERIAGCFLVR